jgi:hypothetical protein
MKVIKALEDRQIPTDKLKYLKDHFVYYEYDATLTLATSCFQVDFPRDSELLTLMREAWSLLWHYYNALILEADKNYWERHDREAFVPVEEAVHRIKLERAIARCEAIKRELSDWQDRLTKLLNK